jgi:hypothetical protein
MGRIEQYTDRWVELSGKTQSYESLKELFVIDLFMEQAVFVKERRPATVDEATEAAEIYELSRQSWGYQSTKVRSASMSSAFWVKRKFTRE